MFSLTIEEKKHFDEIAVQNFQEYLRIPSAHPNVNYDDCINFLERQAKSLNLTFNVHFNNTKKRIAVLTWIGTEPDLTSILLNSHMDVVPAYEEKWNYKPFSADIDENGNIYARGAQDMKSVGIQYLEAIRRLKNKCVNLKRTIHISFVPDEEIGGKEGMQKFTKSEHFRALNIGMALDEGIANPDEAFVLFYGEKTAWKLRVHCPESHCHESLLLHDTAGEKVQYMSNKFFNCREKEKQKLKDNSPLSLGNILSINLTQIYGDIQNNIMPSEFVIVFDCRIPTTIDIKSFEETLNKWCKEAGPGTWIQYEQKEPQVPVTKLDNTNPFWVAFTDIAKSIGIKLKTVICPGETDARYLREMGIPAFGFSPMNNTPILLHSEDEFINKEVFLKGIEYYCDIITALANV